MAKNHVSRSVIYYKRMIAAVLAVIILSLAGLSVVFGVRLRSTRAALAEAQDELFERDLADMQAQAQAEAERLRSAVQPERVKPAGELSAPEILSGTTVIAHALGDVDGNSGLNCLEAFQAHYAAGVRVFEVDMRMSTDGRVILRHDWNSTLQEGIDSLHLPTVEGFRSTPILGQYTPLTFRDLLLLMAEYPDICVITDTKYTEPEAVTAEFQAMVDDAHTLGLSYLFDRMIVQVYSPNNYSVVDNVHHFPHYIYTLYQDYFGGDEDSFRNKVDFCAEHGIMGLTLNSKLWNSDYAAIADRSEIGVYLHTVNDRDAARRFLRTGVRAVYSDMLTPEDLEAD